MHLFLDQFGTITFQLIIGILVGGIIIYLDENVK